MQPMKMPPRTPAQVVQDLTKLPAYGVPYQVPTGTVALYQDPNYTGARSDLRLNDYTPNKRHVVPDAQYNKTSNILWNLPVGVLVTLVRGWAPGEDGKKVVDLSYGNTCLGLVGTGTTEGCELWTSGINNDLSFFLWRNVDLSIGAVELFADGNFTGRLRWKSLGDRQTVTLYDAEDGNGTAYNNVKGWGDIKEVPFMWEVRFNDCISSFRWDRVVPKKEIIAPFNLMTSTVSLNNSNSQTVTVETSDQHVAGISSTFSQTFSAGAEGIATSSTQWSVSVNYSYTRTNTSTRSQTKTVDLNITQTVNAPPKTRYKATLLVTIGQLPATEYVTTAQRWYEQPVANSQIDYANNSWYKRTEEVRLTLTGSLACRTFVDMQTTPL
ncbi:uncharacterized protein EAE97_004400 [Botrytis byssoidea]|uniref:Uncharacterized protein n=1 Tax=Botrytis byssoidea TaxID=139641 RepID=A0A9P5IML0_9HELO|nr:uncharacterized protein EAE97_004400 [Botrytis byssoidea]KAF7947151.1 hypothetical protein EAE97_004400 [Botrytis byssoidea]